MGIIIYVVIGLIVNKRGSVFNKNIDNLSLVPFVIGLLR